MKFALALWILLLCTVSLNAQVKFAASAGYSHNTARIHKNTTQQETGYRPGGYANFRVETEFEGPLYFSGMIGYSLRGYTYQALPDSSIETRIHYVDIAPILNYHLKTSTNNYFNLFAGPVIGVAVAGKQTIAANGLKKTGPMKFSLTNNYSLANIGIQTGLAYHFNKWFVEGSYHLGVSSINNEEEIDKTNIKNRGASIGIGYWVR